MMHKRKLELDIEKREGEVRVVQRWRERDTQWSGERTKRQKERERD